MLQFVNQTKKSMLMTCMALAVALMLFSCTKGDVALSLSYTLSGNGSGNQTVPTSNNNNGSGTMTGNYNSSTKVMTYTSTWANLTGAPVSGGLYTGAIGIIGTSITPWSLGSGVTSSGSFSSTVTLNAAQEAQLFAGKCYYLLTTTANVSGEIRGQITATAQ